jgi:flagellar biosynthesis protein FlhG
MRLARAADKVVMIVTDEPTSMTDAYAFIKVLKGYAPNVEQVVAINQAESRASGQRTYEAIARACQTFLGFRPALAGTVMRDDAVREAIRSQRTLISTDPNTQPIMDAIAIAHTLLGRTAQELHN